MSDKKVVKNYIFNTAYQLVTLLVPLIVTPYISRIFLSEGIGEYSYTYSIMNYFLIVSVLGIHTLGNKIIGTFKNSEYERSKSFWELVILKVIFSTASLILYFALILFVMDDILIAALQGIFILASLFDLGWFFQGMEEFRTLSIKNIVVKLLSTLLIFLMVKSRNDLWIYVLILSLSNVISNLSIIPLVFKWIVFVPPRELNPFSNMKEVLFLFVPTVAVNLFAIIDKTMIGSLVGKTECGYYESAEKIVFMCITLISSLSVVTLGRLSYFFKNGQKSEAEKLISKSFDFLWVMAIPMSVGLFVISKYFVPLFFGQDFTGTIVIMQILSPLFVVLGFNNICGNQVLISSGFSWKYCVFLLVGGTLNVCLNLCLIPSFGAAGAAIASLCGEFFTLVCCAAYLFIHKTVSIRNVAIGLWRPVIASAVSMSGLFFLLTFVPIYSVWALLVAVIVTAIVYLLLLLIMKEPLVLSIFRRVFNRGRHEKTN